MSTYPFENKKIAPNIRTEELFHVSKTQDYYLRVFFLYGSQKWNGAIPIKSRYQGVDVPLTEDDVLAWVSDCYVKLDPANNPSWQDAQRKTWESKEAHDTQMVFNALNGSGDTTQWYCRKCGPVPQVNPQAASRIRDLKKRGYFIATDKRKCPNCGNVQTFDLLVRLPPQSSNCDKREPIPRALQKRIKGTLGLVDVCFAEPITEAAAVIDHKFPSIRWVRGETINGIDMSDEEIRRKFQILTNQTNLQKERYCNRCLRDGIRGDFFGIKWFYMGSAQWRGQSLSDENGCVGCCWYDLAEWKRRFNEELDRMTH